jgi:hypothetical protein
LTLSIENSDKKRGADLLTVYNEHPKILSNKQLNGNVAAVNFKEILNTNLKKFFR